MAKNVEVHIYPHTLLSTDKLTDGTKGNPIPIKEPTLLVWVDYAPGMKFVHRTEYVLFTGSGVHTIPGDWWPVLNGKRILLGENNKWTVISPYLLEIVDLKKKAAKKK
jgi:hypothetical protein